MNHRLSSSKRPLISVLAVSALVAGGSLTWIGAGAQAAPAWAPPGGGTVLQTNMVSDLAGVAAVTDPNLVNPWGISDSSGSPFWLSDNNSGDSTLYSAPAASGGSTASIVPLVVTIPTPVSATGGTPTGTVFNTASGSGAFKVTGVNSSGATVSAPAAFLFDTEDGTILGWAPSVHATSAIIAVDNSGNNFTNPDPNQETGAVYKGLAMATSSTPIVASDANSTALLYASNFRAGTVDVYDANFAPVTLPAGAFTDPGLPAGYAPFNVQVLNGKLYVTYALQDASRHDDTAGPGHGFVDVYNLDGTPGLPGGHVRLISHGTLDSPWGLAITPQGFAGVNAPGGDPVLLVGNFGNGHIHAYDAASGAGLGPIMDPDGEPIVINKLWALRVGNGGNGGAAGTVYFSAGIFDENHGLFGALTTAARGSAEGPAEGQWVQANVDVVQLDLQQLNTDIANGAPKATITQDTQTLDSDTFQLALAERAYSADANSNAS